jgi:hypothetical protein
MLWSLFSAIFANFIRKNWLFYPKYFKNHNIASSIMGKNAYFYQILFFLHSWFLSVIMDKISELLSVPVYCMYCSSKMVDTNKPWRKRIREKTYTYTRKIILYMKMTNFGRILSFLNDILKNKTKICQSFGSIWAYMFTKTAQVGQKPCQKYKKCSKTANMYVYAVYSSLIWRYLKLSCHFNWNILSLYLYLVHSLILSTFSS